MGYFESDGPFDLNMPETIGIMISAYGGTEGRVVIGFSITDEACQTVFYVEGGVHGGKGYINIVGNWPPGWEQGPTGIPFLWASHPPFAMRFEPVGLARATCYVLVEVAGSYEKLC